MDDSDERTPFTTGDEFLRAVIADGDRPPPALHRPLATGEVIADVYEIIERLGEGGMGVVYLARDKKLSRNVALKLIRTGPSNAVGVARLVREAQAIAQLSHPNVVTVYQIGSHDAQPFVAMEYVDGGTARTWISAKPRSWREIVAFFLAAGRGLEAAHRAHLVHRDFKPDNILVGTDGRVRVADFGLVHSTTTPSTTTGTEDSDAAATVTKTGMVMGTPAYMAPEQRRGGLVDAAADQFAFAVALWEALTGSRPVTEGKAIGAPKRAMPGHIEAALRRALNAEPAERWPSMAPLLAELERDPNARRRKIAYAAGAVLAIGVIVALLLSRDSETACNDGHATIAATWNAQRRADLVAALGPRVGALVGDGLDRYANEWAQGHEKACRDTRVTRSQSEDMLDRRMQCLFASRAAIDATVEALTHASAEGKAKAVDAIGRLPALDRCGDIDRLAQQQPLPADPTVRRQLDDAARELESVRVSDFANRADRQALADAALARARAVGWTPLIARALVVHAQQQKRVSRPTEAIAELREAVSIAVARNLTDVGPDAFADLATMLAEEDRVDAADVALLAARAYDHGANPAATQRVLLAAATVASRGHKDDEAIAIARELVASVDKDPSKTMTPMFGRLLLATVMAAAARFDTALPVLDEGIAWGVANLGADHAEVGRYRALRASYVMNLGRLDDAIADAKASLAVLESWYGQEAVQLAEVLLTLGEAYTRKGELEPVMPYLDRALVCARKGDDLELIASIETQRAVYFLGTGDLDHAASAADALVTTAERTGKFYPLLNALLVRGNVLKERKQYADAERDFLRALEHGKSLGEHPAIQNFRVELGRAWIAMGRADEVRTMLAPQAKALVAGHDIDPILVLETHTVLADALYVLGDRARSATTIAVADRVAAANPDRTDLRAIVDDWHAKHR